MKLFKKYWILFEDSLLEARKPFNDTIHCLKEELFGC